MVDAGTLNARVIDVPAILNALPDDLGNRIPSPCKRSEVSFSKVLCADGLFAAGETSNGKFAALWEGHMDVAENMEDLLTVLNFHERQLLEFGVNR